MPDDFPTLRNALPIEDDEVFSRLLDEFQLANQAGTQVRFWERNACSEDLRHRVEKAYLGLEALNRFVEQTQQPQTPRVDPNENFAETYFAQPMRLDRFHIVREVGRGGFGIVYLAEDTSLKRQVAVKVPRIEAWATEDARKRFLKEAEIAAGLDHVHIVPVFEIGESGQGVYIVSLYCPGKNLGQWLLEHPGQFNTHQIVELMCCMASAMAYCHERNVLHRDLKPANVLLFPAEHGSLPFLPRLNDFGLAKVLESALSETGSSVMLGTPLYMAPEQAWSRSEEIGAPTDVYALGAILYELLTGRTPFQASSLAVMLDQIRSELPFPPSKLNKDIPKPLELICLKCLAKEPSDRYASARLLLDDLKRFAQGGPIVAKRLPWGKRWLQWCEQPARLRESSLAIIFANLVLLGTMVLVVLMERFQLIPRSTQDGYLPIVSCSLIMGGIHVPLLYLATLVAKGKPWAGIVTLGSGVFLTFMFFSSLLGILGTSDYYWNDIPGFRVVYGGFCMLAIVQVLASIVGLFAMNSVRFKQSRAAWSLNSARENDPRYVRRTQENSSQLGSPFHRRSILMGTFGMLALVSLIGLLPMTSPLHRIVPFFGKSSSIEGARVRENGMTFNTELNRVYIADSSFDGSSPFTLEAWVKPEATKGLIVNLKGMMSIFSGNGKNNTGPTVVIHESDEKMLYIYDPVPLAYGAWHHIAVVYQFQTIRVYVDGKEATCDVFLDEGKEQTTHLNTVPPIELRAPLANARLIIGGNSPNASPKHRYPFHGQIREVRLSSGARYDSRFTPAKELAADDTTLADYQFPETEVARIEDLSGKSSPAIKTPLNSQ